MLSLGSDFVRPKADFKNNLLFDKWIFKYDRSWLASWPVNSFDDLLLAIAMPDDRLYEILLY